MPTTKKARKKEYLPLGSQFGLWTVIGHIPNQTGKCLCRCQCGTERVLMKYDLLQGKTSSCGCQKRAKAKRTNLERYGAESPLQNEEIKKKAQNTCYERYGCSCSLQSKAIQEKAQNTVREKYGVENPFQAESVKDKIKATMIEKYGEDNPSKIQQFKDKRSRSLQDKYGSDNYFSSQEWKTYLNDHKSDLFSSNGEAALRQYIESLGFKTEKMRKDSSEVDILIPEKNLGIEYNGLYWHSEARRDKDYHIRKSINFAEQGIKIIHIFEHEWLWHQEPVKYRIASILGKNITTLGARKCELVELSKDEAYHFIDKIHLQGRPNSILKAFALTFNGEIMALATFAKHHRNLNQITLNRFCCKPFTTVSGALSRLSKHASHYFKQDIISWCDLRWSSGDGYHKAGWTEERRLKPDYFYFNKNNKRIISKQSRQKKKINTPEGMTEHEHALRDGLLRVYDCGKIRFIYRHSP